MDEPLQARRSILSVVVAVLPGCSALDSGTGDVNDSESPSTGMATTTQGGCSLNHNILDDREHQIVNRYEFDQLSSTAQQYFEEALKNPDSNYEVEGTDQPAPSTNTQMSSQNTKLSTTVPSIPWELESVQDVVSMVE